MALVRPSTYPIRFWVDAPEPARLDDLAGRRVSMTFPAAELSDLDPATIDRLRAELAEVAVVGVEGGRADLEVDVTAELRDLLQTGIPVELTWRSPAGRSTLSGTVTGWSAADRIDVVCDWPPERGDRRRFRRATARLRVWLVDLADPDTVVETTTVDVGAGGIALRLAHQPGDRRTVAVIVAVPDGLVTAVGVIVGGRDRDTVSRVRFDRISPHDEARLVQVVNDVEVHR